MTGDNVFDKIRDNFSKLFVKALTQWHDEVKEKRMTDFQRKVLRLVADFKGEGYGVTIRRAIEKETGRQQSIGGLYVALNVLEARRLITRRPGPATPARGGRPKVLFTITPRGQLALYEPPPSA